jgi:hypothetical protein
MGKYRSLGTFLDRIFRNNLNSNFDDIDADIQAQKIRVDTIVASAGNSNTEVVDARGTFPVLGARLASAETSLADIVTYQPNGVDDTANIQSILNTKGSVRLTRGVYISTLLTLTKGMRIYGDGIGSTTIKLKDNTNTTLLYLHNADEGTVTNLKLDGNKANNTAPIDSDVSLILVKNDIGYSPSSLYLNLNKLVLINGCNNGLYFKAKNSGFIWVVNTDSIQILECNGYGFRDETTDNCFSNFYISGCKLADMFLYYCASNKYVNFKCDNGGFINSGATSQIDGANIIMVHAGNHQFTNFDSQSSYYVGIKMFTCGDNILNAWVDSNGMHWANNDVSSLGTGIALYDCFNITGSLLLTDGQHRQTTDLYTDPTCLDISFNSKTFNPSKIKNNGVRCVITSLEELFRTKPTKTLSNLTYYVDSVNGNDSNSGLSVGVGTAFKTINKAVSMIPQIVNHTVTINIAAGNYNEYVTLSGFFGSGTITIKGASAVANAPNYGIQVFDINNCTVYVSIVGFNANDATNPFKITDCSAVAFAECSTTNASQYGWKVARSKISTYDCTASNKANAIQAGNMSFVSSSTWVSSTGNSTGIYCVGSIVLKDGVQPTATTAQVVANGGFIN